MASPTVRGVVLCGLLLVAGLAVVQAKQVGDDHLKPEGAATCWECHGVVQGDCNPLQTFVNLIPASGAGADLGDTFDFTVQAQNAWCADFWSVRVNLDLTKAPSLGFASGVPAVGELFQGAIPIDAQAAAQPQRSQPFPVEVPAGETHMEVRLRPESGPTGGDLALLVFRPGDNLNGAPTKRIDAGFQGEDEVFVIDNREEFIGQGYGTWTFVAETTLVPKAAGGVSASIPSASGSVPFELSVDAKAEDTGARTGSLGAAADPARPLAGAASIPVTFRLVALAAPADGESLMLSGDVWPHYRHQGTNAREDDDENVTKVMPAAVPVVAQGTRVILQPDATMGPGVATVANGPTMATVSEAVGYTTALLLVASVATGGMFGKASRRGLNAVFGAAKRRVAFHNFLSYGILLAASVHTVLFLVEAAYDWTAGLLWGGLAVLSLLGLGVTGAFQIPLIRAWGHGGWRWTHYGMAVAAILFTVAHGALDGAHFTDIQRALGWQDPLGGRLAA